MHVCFDTKLPIILIIGPVNCHHPDKGLSDPVEQDSLATVGRRLIC